ncbi:MAG TPA: pseudouridine-5'-phosphate glycosidase [Anaerolineales bacterium]|nr:pseudouridine-5'-phosphate glycosidase [Anaerolineales bacterium]
MLPSNLSVHPEVREALEAQKPVVALESTVISHGLPWPENFELARRLEARVRAGGATPATIALLRGEVRVGLTEAEIEHFARTPGIWKISRRDYAVAAAQKRDGATTVAGTMIAAHWAGIRVFATGGIGGVHRAVISDPSSVASREASPITDHRSRITSYSLDISADLPELARTPVMVVCAGAKAILDLPATLEWLETHGVPVVGYQTDEFPAFYSRESGLRLEARADTPAEVAAIARCLWEMGLTGGLLVCAPCPAEAAKPMAEMESAIAVALREAGAKGVRGKTVTPFLLARVSELTGGESKAANLALLQNNAEVAAEIAAALVSR